MQFVFKMKRFYNLTKNQAFLVKMPIANLGTDETTQYYYSCLQHSQVLDILGPQQ